MVRLVTQNPEVSGGRVPSPPGVRPSSLDTRGLGRTIEQSLDTSFRRDDSSALAGLAQELLSLDHIDQELQETTGQGLSVDEVGDLQNATTDVLKIKALEAQRKNTRSGTLQRNVALRAFIAQNPRLVTEATALFGSAVGRAPGAGIRELEQDEIASQIAELDPAAQYNQADRS